MARTALPSTKANTAKGKVSSERFEKIFELLLEAGEEGVFQQKIMEVLDISDRTVQRAITALGKDQAVIVRSEKGKKGVHYVLSAPPQSAEIATPGMDLLLGNLQQLSSKHWGPHFQGVLTLLRKHMRKKDQDEAEFLATRVLTHGSVRDLSNTPLPAVEAILVALKSWRNLRLNPLLIRYRTPRQSEASERRVLAHSLVHDILGGGSFLLAWDLNKGAVRQFRLSRIESAQLDGIAVLLPTDAGRDLERAARYQIGGWIGTDEPETIELEIEGAQWVAAFKDAPPVLPEFEMREHSEDRLRISFKATEYRAPLRWVLQFGTAVEVVGPDSFKEAYRRTIRTIWEKIQS